MINYIKSLIKAHRENKMMKEYARVKNIITFEEFFEEYNK